MDVFMGTILGFGFNYAPSGWAQAQGQLIPTSQNSALFALLGVTYGGNGQNNFALPNLTGRAAVGWGPASGGVSPYTIGQAGGSESTTLLTQNMPAHNHAINVNSGTASTLNAPGNTAYFGLCDGSDPTSGDAVTVNIYTPTAPNTQLNPNSMSVAGQSQPFDNRSPYLAITYCIALTGIYPSRP